MWTNEVTTEFSRNLNLPFKLSISALSLDNSFSTSTISFTDSVLSNKFFNLFSEDSILVILALTSIYSSVISCVYILSCIVSFAYSFISFKNSSNESEGTLTDIFAVLIS